MESTTRWRMPPEAGGGSRQPSGLNADHREEVGCGDERSLDPPPVCRASTSRNCSKIVTTGFREFMALWKTMETFRQRQAASRA